MAIALFEEEVPDGMPCAHCGALPELVTGQTIYPHRRDLWVKYFWRCAPCGAYVGCHRPGAVTDRGESDGTLPLGRPANAELRRARGLLHKKLDALWQNRKKNKRTARRRAYRILQRELSLPKQDAHVAMFDIDQCREAWRALSGITPQNVMSIGRFDPVRDTA